MDHLSSGNLHGIIVVGSIALLVLVRALWPSPRSIRAVIFDKWGMGVCVAFIAGTLVGALFRFLFGSVIVGNFATGSAPLVAGILVGVIVNGIGASGKILWHRQLALIYLLMGSLATALGTINASNGWFFSACFVIICGSLAASVCLTTDIVINRPEQPAPVAS